jgi:hypothetical protein
MVRGPTSAHRLSTSVARSRCRFLAIEKVNGARSGSVSHRRQAAKGLRMRGKPVELVPDHVLLSRCRLGRARLEKLEDAGRCLRHGVECRSHGIGVESRFSLGHAADELRLLGQLGHGPHPVHHILVSDPGMGKGSCPHRDQAEYDVSSDSGPASGCATNNSWSLTRPRSRSSCRRPHGPACDSG